MVDVRAPGQEPRVLPGGAASLDQIAVSPDGTRIAAATTDGVLLRPADAGARAKPVLLREPDLVYAVAFWPDGARLVSAGEDGRLRVWDAREGPSKRPAILGRHSSVRSLAVSPDGERLVSGGDDGRLRVWAIEAGTGQEPLVLPGHRESVTSVAFSRDGRVILSAAGGTVRLSRCVPCGPLDELLGFARGRVVRELTAVERANFLGE